MCVVSLMFNLVPSQFWCFLIDDYRLLFLLLFTTHSSSIRCTIRHLRLCPYAVCYALYSYVCVCIDAYANISMFICICVGGYACNPLYRCMNMLVNICMYIYIVYISYVYVVMIITLIWWCWCVSVHRSMLECMAATDVLFSQSYNRPHHHNS